MYCTDWSYWFAFMVAVCGINLRQGQGAPTQRESRTCAPKRTPPHLYHPSLSHHLLRTHGHALPPAASIALLFAPLLRRVTCPRLHRTTQRSSFSRTGLRSRRPQHKYPSSHLASFRPHTPAHHGLQQGLQPGRIACPRRARPGPPHQLPTLQQRLTDSFAGRRRLVASSPAAHLPASSILVAAPRRIRQAGAPTARPRRPSSGPVYPATTARRL